MNSMPSHNPNAAPPAPQPAPQPAPTPQQTAPGVQQAPRAPQVASQPKAGPPTVPQEAPRRPSVAGNAPARATGAIPAAVAGAVPPLEDLRTVEKAGALVMSARSALRRGQREETRKLLQQAFALSPTDCGALELLGDMFLEEGEQEKAIKVFERGLQYHPKHAPFEEKLALAHLDLSEMERDRALREAARENPLAVVGDKRLQERKPNAVGLLSFMLPGAGQFYNEEPERGAVFLAIAVVAFCAWCIPWRLGLLGGPVGKVVLALLALLWFGVHVAAAVDAAQSVKRAQEEQKHLYGI